MKCLKQKRSQYLFQKDYTTFFDGRANLLCENDTAIEKLWTERSIRKNTIEFPLPLPDIRKQLCGRHFRKVRKRIFPSNFFFLMRQTCECLLNEEWSFFRHIDSKIRLDSPSIIHSNGYALFAHFPKCLS